MAIRESFLRKIWGVASFGMAKASNMQNFSLHNRIFHKFSKLICTAIQRSVYSTALFPVNFLYKVALHLISFSVLNELSLPVSSTVSQSVSAFVCESTHSLVPRLHGTRL